MTCEICSPLDNMESKSQKPAGLTWERLLVPELVDGTEDLNLDLEATAWSVENLESDG